MRRFLSLLLAVTVTAALLLLPWASAAGEIYFTAVNDQILPLSDSTMPVSVGGVMYMPYSIFNPDEAGASLGVYFSQNPTSLTLFSIDSVLVFDLTEGYSYDQTQTYTYKAITRNGRTYVPISFVCSFFGLSYTATPTESGTLLRVKSSAAILSDAGFADAASFQMEIYLRDYNKLHPSVSPSPSSSSPSVSPSASAPGDSRADVTVQLSFTVSDAERTAAVLQLLDGADRRALFFFPADRLEEFSDLILRVSATGSGVGLVPAGDDYGASLAAAQVQLSSLCCLFTRMVLLPEEDAAARAALESAGYVVWDADVTGVGGRTGNLEAQAVTNGISRRKTRAGVLLEDSDLTVAALPRVLAYLRTYDYTVRPATEMEH